MPDTQRCWEMFHNFMSFTGCCRTALVKVNYNLLCDPIEKEGEGERETGGEKTESDWFLLIHNDKMDKMVEQVASASFVGLLAGIY